MAFLSELLLYLFKFVILLAAAIIAVICGVKMKKNKIAKANAEKEKTDIESVEKDTKIEA